MPRLIRGSRTAVVEPSIPCRCGDTAISFMEVHAADYCNVEPSVGQFFCGCCLVQHVEIAQEIADDGGESCDTCGLRFGSLADIIVKICHIEQG